MDSNKAKVQKLKDATKPPVNQAARKFHTNEEFDLTIYFLIFAAFVLIIAAILLYNSSNDSSTSFKYFIITLLILAMLLLMTVGWDKDQISPAVGLFGTISGYLLGKTDLTAPPPKKNINTQNPE